MDGPTSALSKLLSGRAFRGMNERKNRLARLLLMYNRLHEFHLGPVPRKPKRRLPQLPEVGRIAKVEAAAIGSDKGADPYLATIERTGDPEAAAFAAAMSLLRRGQTARSRTVVAAMQNYPGTATAGDVARGILADRDEEPEVGWQLFAKHDPARVIALAPAEFFRIGFTVAPDEAAALLGRVRSGEIDSELGPRAWRAIANAGFAAGFEELSRWAADQAVASLDVDGIENRADIEHDIARLREWYGRRDQRDELAAAHPIAFAILTGASPQPHKPGKTPDDKQRDVVLGALAAVGGATYDGDPKLVQWVTDLAAARPTGSAGTGPTVRLCRAGRDATSYADVPRGTWLIVVGKLPHPLFGIATDLPFDDRYRPVFASVAVDRVAALTPAVLDQLRRAAPVGCANWETYYLMRAANIPAFLADDAPDSVPDVVASIVSGATEAEIFDGWRSRAESAVAAGISRDAAVAGLPPIKTDLERICHDVRARSIVIERSRPGPPGEEINVEFSLDGNLKHHMVVVLDSIVRRASRPIRLFVMCRDHDTHDFDRLADRFPTVSFVWLPTDGVDYGGMSDAIRHLTVATMDRLLLPEMLLEIDRVIHHDLDAVCLADLAELADLDLAGHPIAAVTTERAAYRSGINELRKTARRLKAKGSPDLARELLARSHLRHSLDFVVFNAGVMVFDLARMRADHFSRAFFPYAERFGMNDQAVLNAYAGADRLMLDPAWNWCPRITNLDNPKIAHWSGPFKPWGPDWVNARELWQEAETLAMAAPRTPHASSPTT